MSTRYHIHYRVMESGQTYSGDMFGLDDMEHVLETLRRRYLDFSIIHAELIAEFEVPDEPKLSSTSGENVSILGTMLTKLY